MPNRCTVVDLPLRNLADAAADPKVAPLLEQDWRVVAALPLREEDGPAVLRILLRPPRAHRDTTTAILVGVGLLLVADLVIRIAMVAM